MRDEWDTVGVQASPIFRQGMTLLTLDSSSFGVLGSERQRVDDLSFDCTAGGVRISLIPQKNMKEIPDNA